MTDKQIPPGTVARTLVGGPLDGYAVALPPRQDVFRYEMPEDDLERLLEASVAVKQGKLVPLPTKTAVYRLRKLGDEKVVPLQRYVMRFSHWE